MFISGSSAPMFPTDASVIVTPKRHGHSGQLKVVH